MKVEYSFYVSVITSIHYAARIVDFKSISLLAVKKPMYLKICSCYCAFLNTQNSLSCKKKKPPMEYIRLSAWPHGRAGRCALALKSHVGGAPERSRVLKHHPEF